MGEQIMETFFHDAGKGDSPRKTDHAKFSANYDQIKWTREEDEEFDRINKNSPSTQCPVAQDGTEGDSKTKE